LPPYEAEKGVR